MVLVAADTVQAAFAVGNGHVVERVALLGESDDIRMGQRHAAHVHAAAVLRDVLVKFGDLPAQQVGFRMLPQKGALQRETFRMGDVVAVHAENVVVRAVFDARVQGFAQADILRQRHDFERQARPPFIQGSLQILRDFAVQHHHDFVCRLRLRVQALQAFVQERGLFAPVNRY